MSQVATNPRLYFAGADEPTPVPPIVPGKSLTKGQLVALLSRAVDLPKAAVENVLDGLAAVAKSELHLGPGTFKVPGVVTLKLKEKPARQETRRINPFTKEPMVVPAKPATRVVKAAVPKGLQPE